jgi:hypothetical protein
MDLWVLAGLVVAAGAGAAAVAVVGPTIRSSAPARVAQEVDRFKERYRRLRDDQTVMSREALAVRPECVSYPEIPMFTAPGWIFDTPVDIAAVEITLHEGTTPVPGPIKQLKGLTLAGPIRYSEAIQLLSPDSQYFNGTIYRPISISTNGDNLAMEFEPSRYFEYLDTSEVLAYAASLTRHSPLRARRAVTNPFDLIERVASLGVLTLTIVKGDRESSFFLHKRSGKFVVGDALYHVVPAGEFAPSDIGVNAIRADFSLWRNIMREYAEEYLGMPDAQGQGGRRLDYENGSPFSELSTAMELGSLRVYALGIGLDSLTFKPEILTVAIFERDGFEEIFHRPFARTDEGTIIEDIPLTEESVRDYVEHPAIRSGARACLMLTWQHRDLLGL